MVEERKLRRLARQLGSGILLALEAHEVSSRDHKGAIEFARMALRDLEKASESVREEDEAGGPSRIVGLVAGQVAIHLREEFLGWD